MFFSTSLRQSNTGLMKTLIIDLEEMLCRFRKFPVKVVTRHGRQKCPYSVSLIANFNICF